MGEIRLIWRRRNLRCVVCECSTASLSHTARIASGSTSYVLRQSPSVRYGLKLSHRPGESVPSLVNHCLSVRVNSNNVDCN